MLLSMVNSNGLCVFQILYVEDANRNKMQDKFGFLYGNSSNFKGIKDSGLALNY